MSLGAAEALGYLLGVLMVLACVLSARRAKQTGGMIPTWIGLVAIVGVTVIFGTVLWSVLA